MIFFETDSDYLLINHTMFEIKLFAVFAKANNKKQFETAPEYFNITHGVNENALKTVYAKNDTNQFFKVTNINIYR